MAWHAGLVRTQRNGSCIVDLDNSIKACSPPSVTRLAVAFDVHAQPEDILIAIGTNFRNSQGIAALFAFAPEFCARS